MLLQRSMLIMMVTVQVKSRTFCSFRRNLAITNKFRVRSDQVLHNTQLYEELHFKKFAVGKMTLKVTQQAM